MDTGRVGTRSPHKSLRTSCCKGESCVSKTWRPCSPSSRQSDGCLLHSSSGRNEVFSPVSRGLSALERQHFQGNNSVVSPVAVDKRKRNCGLPEPTKHSSVGVSVITRNIHVSFGSFSPKSNSGCIRERENAPTNKIHVLVPRPSGSSSECTVTQVGQGLLPIPSSPSDPKVSTKCNERKNRDHNCSSLANNDMVVIDSGDIGGCSLVASTQL